MVHLLLNIAFILGNDTGVWPANSTWREDIRWCQNPVAMRCQHDINKGAKELRASAEPPLLLRGGCGLMDWVTTSNIHRSRWPVGHWGLRMHTGESPALIAIVKGHRISHKRIQHSELTSSFLRVLSGAILVWRRDVKLLEHMLSIKRLSILLFADTAHIYQCVWFFFLPAYSETH